MKRLQHLSVIMESVPVLWDGDFRVADAMVGGMRMEMINWFAQQLTRLWFSKFVLSHSIVAKSLPFLL